MSHFVYFSKGPAINLDLVTCVERRFDDNDVLSLTLYYLSGPNARVTGQDAIDLWDHIQSNGICLGNWEIGSGG